MKNEVVNAKIESTILGYEDHGIMTLWLHLTYGGSGQGFGGYALDKWIETSKKRVGTGLGLDMIGEILQIADVDQWEKLPGRYVRVHLEDGLIVGIGDILKDKWFFPRQLFKK